MAWDIAKLLLVPKQLQALEIHVDDGTAMRLEYALEQKGVEFPHLQDITLSINLRFLLNYAPNVRRLSNRPRETWRSAKRRFEGREWQELFELCSELHWLETLDLYLGTEIPSEFLASEDHQYRDLTLLNRRHQDSSTSHKETAHC